ncbi:hypothetical protein IH992_32360 [Candidatus Poribacteria bacterium]|nr:hypothetical protein [Candidatus Poribacteria bacterium]
MKLEELYRIGKARQFEMKAKWPISWKGMSSDLKHAADRLYDLHQEAHQRIIERILEELKERKRGKKSEASRRVLEGKELEDHLDARLFIPYFLLIGYAIENLLKANLMVQHPEYFKPNAKMVDIRSHNLVSLCKRCNISIDTEETNLLEKLTRYIEWEGKYPIPLEADKSLPRKRDDGTWERQFEDGFKIPKQSIDSLYAKLWNELECQYKTAANDKI